MANNVNGPAPSIEILLQQRWTGQPKKLKFPRRLHARSKQTSRQGRREPAATQTHASRQSGNPANPRVPATRGFVVSLSSSRSRQHRPMCSSRGADSGHSAVNSDGGDVDGSCVPTASPTHARFLAVAVGMCSYRTGKTQAYRFMDGMDRWAVQSVSCLGSLRLAAALIYLLLRLL